MALRPRAWGWVLALAAAVAGCRAPAPVPAVPPPPPPLPPPDLPVVVPGSLVPDYRTLPAFDPRTASPADVAPPPSGHRGLSEEVCRREAAARATLAFLLNRESAIPDPSDPSITDAATQLSREVRKHLADDARNRAASEALDEFFQMADAEGRADAVRESLPVLDKLRETVREARARGVRVPLDPDELDRQRATLLAGLGQADLAARALDVDLRRRIGAPGRGGERVRPTGSFAVSAEPIDPDAAVALALESRPDLRALRASYLSLSPESLSVVRDVIRAAAGPASPIQALARLSPPRPLPIISILVGRNRARQLEGLAFAEVAVRRQQLYELIIEKERGASDEVRAAAAALAVQAKQVGLARWRAEELAKKATDVKGQGPLVELPAEVEASRARSEVVTAVMGWHRARVKLAAAQGQLYGGEGGPLAPRVAVPSVQGP